MEVVQGSAVYYKDSSKKLLLAYVETVRDRQVSSEWIQGLELAIITDLAEEESDLIEVMLTDKKVFALKSQITRIAQFASEEIYSGIPRGCTWRRTIFKSVSQEPPPLCICRRPVQSDPRTAVCHACKAVSHLECVSGQDCPKCGTQLLAGSRKASQEAERPSPVRFGSEGERKTPSAYVQVAKYPLLTTQFATRLQQRLAKLTTESAKIQLRLSDSEIPRQIFKDKVFSALLLSQAECASLEVEDKSTAKDMLEIAIEVEAAVYESANSLANNKVYTEKARMLAFNLLDVKNPDFRRSLLHRTVAPHSLPLMTSRDVASSSLKRRREEKEKELLEEKVISSEIQRKVIVKSRKGEGMLELAQTSIVKPLDMPKITSENPPALIPERLTSPSKRTESDQIATNPAVIPSQKPERKPWIPDSVYETVLENSHERLSAMIKRRFETYLRPHQATNLTRQSNIS